MTNHQLAHDYYHRNVAGFEDRLDEQIPLWHQNADLLRTWFRDWALDGYLNIELLVSWVTDDFVHQDPMNLGHDGTSREDFRRSIEDAFTAFPDCTFLDDGPLGMSLEGNTIVFPWRSTGNFSGPLTLGPPGQRRRFAPNGRAFDFRGIDLYTFRGDKLSQLRSLYDPVDIAQQIGLLPPTRFITRLAPRPQALLAGLQRMRG